MSNQESPLSIRKASSSRSPACRSAPPVPAGWGSIATSMVRPNRSLSGVAAAYSTTRPASKPASSRIRRKPCRPSSNSRTSRNGPPPTSSSGLGMSAVSAPRRVPRPPHRITACSIMGSTCRGVRAAVKRERAPHRWDAGCQCFPAPDKANFMDSGPAVDRLRSMYRFRDRNSSAGALADVLFPELAGSRAVSLAEGILRAPPRGSLPPPRLSTLPAAGGPDAPAGAPTPEAVLAEHGWEEERCCNAPGWRDARWWRREPAAPGGTPKPMPCRPEPAMPSLHWASRRLPAAALRSRKSCSPRCWRRRSPIMALSICWSWRRPIGAARVFGSPRRPRRAALP